MLLSHQNVVVAQPGQFGVLQLPVFLLHVVVTGPAALAPVKTHTPGLGAAHSAHALPHPVNTLQTDLAQETLAGAGAILDTATQEIPPLPGRDIAAASLLGLVGPPVNGEAARVITHPACLLVVTRNVKTPRKHQRRR